MLVSCPVPVLNVRGAARRLKTLLLAPLGVEARKDYRLLKAFWESMMEKGLGLRKTKRGAEAPENKGVVPKGALGNHCTTHIHM